MYGHILAVSTHPAYSFWPVHLLNPCTVFAHLWPRQLIILNYALLKTGYCIYTSSPFRNLHILCLYILAAVSGIWPQNLHILASIFTSWLHNTHILALYLHILASIDMSWLHNTNILATVSAYLGIFSAHQGTVHCKLSKANAHLKTITCEAGPGTTRIYSLEICIWSLLILQIVDGFYFPDSVSHQNVICTIYLLSI
jgi:hypothetical protein